MKRKIIIIIIVGVLFILFGRWSLYNFCVKNSDQTYVQEVTPIPVTIVSKVIEEPLFDSTKNIPSYCIPQYYTICRKSDGKFGILMPYSISPEKEIFNSIEEAQVAINNKAHRCKIRWIETKGEHFYSD